MRDMRNRRRSGEDIPLWMYDLEGIENARIEPEADDEIPTIVLTDYKGYADVLRQGFEDARKRYRDFIGSHSNDDLIKLKHLVSTTAEHRSAWSNHSYHRRARRPTQCY